MSPADQNPDPAWSYELGSRLKVLRSSLGHRLDRRCHGATTPAAAVVMGLRQYSYVGALFGFVCALDIGRLGNRTP
jgi:hypothetical protein